MAPFTIESFSYEGHDAVRLGSPGHGLEAILLPELGFVGASLRHEGEELLGRAESLEQYASRGSTMGIPLLHPWANRLAGPRYDVAGTAVDLDLASPLLALDASGLPIHGVVGPRLPWTILEQRASATAAVLAGALDYSGSQLLAVFPFPHRLEQVATLDVHGLTVTTTLVPTGAAAVPVAFGYHPYLTVPGAPRSEWRIEAPSLRRLLLDERWIPTGADEPWSGLAGPLDRDYDDGFAGVPAGTELSAAGAGRRIAVTFLDGYPYAQIYAPNGTDFICFEPMTAPANALVSGAGLRLVEPGDRFQAVFRISVAAA